MKRVLGIIGLAIMISKADAQHVGIGTTDPLATLHLHKSSANPGSNNVLLIHNSSSGGAGIQFMNQGVASNPWQCFLHEEGSFRIGRLQEPDVLTINQFGGAGFVGDLGLGISSPVYRLDARINTPDATVAQFKTTGGIADVLIQNETQQLNMGVDNLGGYLRTNAPNDLRVQTGEDNRIFIDHETGNVGIGTNNPAARLYVSVDSELASVLGTFEGTGNTDKHIVVGNSDRLINMGVNENAGYVGTLPAADFEIRTGNIDRLRIIHTNGFVGIGTDSPSEQLDVNGNLNVSGHIVVGELLGVNFQNGWDNYGSGYGDPSYYKDKQNRVYLSGLAGHAGTTLGVVFILPEEFRPQSQMFINLPSDDPDGWSRVIIDASNGEVRLVGTVDIVQWISFDGVSFRAN